MVLLLPDNGVSMNDKEFEEVKKMICSIENLEEKVEYLERQIEELERAY